MPTRLGSGIAELDRLLGGGVEHGTSTLIAGAAGTGKSSITAQFVHTAAVHGAKALMVIFDESESTLLSRAEALNIGLRKYVESGAVTLRQVDPAELSPGELVHRICGAVENSGVTLVVIRDPLIAAVN